MSHFISKILTQLYPKINISKEIYLCQEQENALKHASWPFLDYAPTFLWNQYDAGNSNSRHPFSKKHGINYTPSLNANETDTNY